MQRYVRDLNGTLFIVSLPVSLLVEGGVIVGFDKLSHDELAEHGYYPVTDAAPVDLYRYRIIATIYTLVDGVAIEAVTTEALTDADKAALLSTAKQQKIAEAYRQAKDFLDSYSIGYSTAEIATFPILQVEILLYNSSGAIGTMMQSVIARGRHTAATLSALLTPKINAQIAALQARDDHVANIMALTTAQEVVDYDLTA